MIRGFVAWGPAALWAAVLFLLSALPRVPGVGWLPGADKVAHFGLYAVMGALLAWGRVRSGSGVAHAWPLSLGMLYALGDEWHQSFVPGRDPSVGDFIADVLGTAGGYLVLFLLLARASGRRMDPGVGLAPQRDR